MSFFTITVVDWQEEEDNLCWKESWWLDTFDKTFNLYYISQDKSWLKRVSVERSTFVWTFGLYNKNIKTFVEWQEEEEDNLNVWMCFRVKGLNSNETMFARIWKGRLSNSEFSPFLLVFSFSLQKAKGIKTLGSTFWF